MGSTNGDADEQPVHTVTITQGFWMQKTEVTVEQWVAMMGSTPSRTSCGEPNTDPVEGVSWTDVQAFNSALNAANPGAGYRLPTEAEWEYAARAGTTGDFGGTGVLGEMGWYDANQRSPGKQPAGTKLPNAWGLFDMHGNVQEWVMDWHAANYCGVSPQQDPQGPATGGGRVWRSGAWFNPSTYARSANRNSFAPTFSYGGTGFRLVRGPNMTV